ncbi:MAG: DUF1697 domain-containing protein [Cyanobacteria bacterium P01_F01_bin.3]
MRTYIALLRGINVGGKNKLPMKSLVALLEELGCQQVRTYIQSGNAVFSHETTNSTELANRISAAIKESHGFEPRVLLLEKEALEKIIAQNPFPAAESEPKTLHVYFLESVPLQPDLEGLESVKLDSERFALKANAFYLHAPDGLGRSKLAAKAEKLIGVAATARNWRTVSKLADML